MLRASVPRALAALCAGAQLAVAGAGNSSGGAAHGFGRLSALEQLRSLYGLNATGGAAIVREPETLHEGSAIGALPSGAAPNGTASVAIIGLGGTPSSSGAGPDGQEHAARKVEAGSDPALGGAMPLEDVPEVAEAQRPFPPTDPLAYLWWLLILYMFYMMAIVCDEYLVPTVDIMCERWAIPEDVAGATLMAFACNGPELLTNTCAIFITESKVGMGTIVGSAIFNVLVITGACPIVVPGGVLDIPCGTFLRDALFSAFSIVVLAWALPVIDLFRASVLLGMAFVYVYVVAKFRTWFGEPSEAEINQMEQKMQAREEQAAKCRELFVDRKFERNLSDSLRPAKGEPVLDQTRSRTSSDTEEGAVYHHLGFARQVSAQEAYTTGPHDRKELWPEASPVAKPEFKEAQSLASRVWSWLVFVLVYPTTVALYLTIPDVKVESKKSRYVSAFFLSMAWLSGTAWVVCLGSDWINFYWGIPQSFLGLTLAAVGTSFPNLFASMITARAGRGPIAVSNALGSNVQNVFLVLALPIWIRVLQKGEYSMSGGDINVSIIWMAVSLGAVVICVMGQKFQLTAQAGWFFMVVYFAFLVHMTAYTT